MGVNTQVLVVVCIIMMIMCFASTSYAGVILGNATFHRRPYVPSACNGYKDDGVFIAAASDVVFAKRRACGREYFVVCLGGVNKGSNPCKHHSAVVVKIVDHCPPSCRSTISLSQEAFSVLADPSVGRVRIALVDTKA